MEKILTLLVILVIALNFGCGRRDDPHYVDCKDGSNSEMCVKLDQQELAQFIGTEREYFYFASNIPSIRVGNDENIIQTYLLNEKHFRWNHNAFFNYWDKWLKAKKDMDLICRFESFFGVVKEEGERECHTLTIFGNERKTPIMGCYPYPRTRGEQGVRLYYETKRGCY